MPKGFIKKLSLTKNKTGPARRQEILDDIDDKGTFLPRGVMYEDMDKSFIDFVDKDLELVIEGERVPVIFLTLQKWSEFSKTWQHSDKYKNIKMPFITIVRQPNPQVGQNQAGLFNIPGRKMYTYMKVPTFEGGRKGVDVYKIPQPTSVDITYEVRLFCNRMRDLNKLNIRVQQAFQSIQHYVTVNGHPMPLLLENIGDESNIDSLDKRRFYVQPFEIRLQGYILDEDQFEVIPAINRAMLMVESDTELRTDEVVNTGDKVNIGGEVPIIDGEVVIKNTDGSFELSIPNFGRVTLDDEIIQVENDDGVVLNTVPNPLYQDIIIEVPTFDVAITNSGSTFSVSSAGEPVILPNINHTDSDGSTITLPAQTPVTCSPSIRNYMELVIDTTIASGTPSDSIQLAILGGGGIVDWGEGNGEELYVLNSTHQYTVGGVYTIKLMGTFNFRWHTFGDAPKVLDIKNCGLVIHMDNRRTWQNCINMNCTATDEYITTTADSSRMFENCQSLITPPKIKDTSSFIEVNLWCFNTSLNADLGYMDLRQCTNFAGFAQGVTTWSIENYGNTLMGWLRWDETTHAPQVGWVLQSNQNFHGGSSTIVTGSEAALARDYLINTLNWTITDGGLI